MPTTAPPAIEPLAFTSGPIADLSSAYVAAAAISAAHELGLLDQLDVTGEFSLTDFGNGIDEHVLETMCNALAWAQVVRKQGNRISRGAGFSAAFAARGYFYWLVRGCGELFSTAPAAALTDNRHGEFYRRDLRAVSVGSALIAETEVERVFDAALADLSYRAVADLGCGSGQRLIRIAERDPAAGGLGLDIAPEAVELATANVAAAGLANRISIYQSDVSSLADSKRFPDIDVITCIFTGNDFWPYDRCVRILRGLRVAFPNAHTLLLCDICRSTWPPDASTPIFRLGFELVHALMGVYLPTLAQWHEAFRAAGWRCAAIRPTDSPPGCFLLQLSPVVPADLAEQPAELQAVH